MDKSITCNTEVDTFLATSFVKPMDTEKPRKTVKEMKKLGEELETALDAPMPDDFFDSAKEEVNIENSASTSLTEDEKIKCELKEKIRVWEKNRQAFLDLAGLLCVLKTNIGSGISGAALFFRVLNNLQDPEITVEYKGDSLLEEYNKLHKEINTMANQYSKVIPEVERYFEHVRSMDADGYLYDYGSCFLDEDGNTIHWYRETYNLLESLIKAGQIKWIRELLSSNINSERRLAMLDDIIKNNEVSLNSLVEDSNWPDSIYPEVQVLEDRVWVLEDEESIKEEKINIINDLIKMWAKEMVPMDENKYQMVRDMKFENLKFLQENGIIDFVHDITYSSSYGTVAVPAQIYCKNRHGIYNFASFYDTESYQKLPQEIKQNTDRCLIDCIIGDNLSEIDRLIQRKNFPITDENVQEIIKALSSNQDAVYQWNINKICEEIEKKSKTPKEYRKAKQYTGQIRDALDPEKLEQQRQELVRRLMNMNESLQEQVPGKMKIKDIKFQVKNQ